MWNKLSPRGPMHLMRISSTPVYKPFHGETASLNVSSDYVEVWCVPSATHMPCVHRSQNEVPIIVVLVTLFLILLCAIHLKHIMNFNVFGALIRYPEFSQAPWNCIP
jgi:hypothetical protein